VETASRFARDLAVQITGHELLKARGIELIQVDAPNHFIEEAPTAIMVRQLGLGESVRKGDDRLETARGTRAQAGGHGQMRRAQVSRRSEPERGQTGAQVKSSRSHDPQAPLTAGHRGHHGGARPPGALGQALRSVVDQIHARPLARTLSRKRAACPTDWHDGSLLEGCAAQYC
jgi:hypothetical protein